ncbi:type I toxin-antitoxin system Fst family toxin [Enterococcus sp. RIT-PI-f]|nr:type I toxin-antitoxin system Fst family toxin [Enterococcus sp. RIT-PI-f]
MHYLLLVVPQNIVDLIIELFSHWLDEKDKEDS